MLTGIPPIRRLSYVEQTIIVSISDRQSWTTQRDTYGEAIRPTPRVISLRDIIESGDRAFVQRWVQETEDRLPLGEASIIDQRNHGSEDGCGSRCPSNRRPFAPGVDCIMAALSGDIWNSSTNPIGKISLNACATRM